MKLFSLALVLAAGCVIPPPGGGAGSSTMPSSGGPPPSGSYQAQPAAAGADPNAQAAPAAPAQVSVELHNDCPNQVKLFFGEKPKFGSGTYTSLDSNNTSSYSMKPGDMIWIVDEGQNGLSSMSAGTGTFQRMTITSSCSGFAPN